MLTPRFCRSLALLVLLAAFGHEPHRTSLEDRTAGLAITIPLREP